MYSNGCNLRVFVYAPPRAQTDQNSTPRGTRTRQDTDSQLDASQPLLDNRYIQVSEVTAAGKTSYSPTYTDWSHITNRAFLCDDTCTNKRRDCMTHEVSDYMISRLSPSRSADCLECAYYQLHTNNKPIEDSYSIHSFPKLEAKSKKQKIDALIYAACCTHFFV